MGESLKRQAWEALETDVDESGYRGLRIFLAALIVLTVASVALSTVPWIRARYARGLQAFELVTVVLITIEFGVRVWACTADPRYSRPIVGRLRYMALPLSIVDIVSIVPSYISLAGLDLRFLRVLRLLRLVRVLKLGRYSEGLGRLDDVVHEKRGELVASMLLIGILLTLVSGLMYVAENDAQPAVFASLPDAMWWSVLMMTGDFGTPPVTAVGRMLGVAIAVLGLGVFALPAGIIASGFLEKLGDERSAERDE